ncbi:Cuticle protein [Homarus americanus]|uniref:Cuticle protein n=2 Tax=Homarus americanus TaxID=6706 RepID=A0A8J5TLQ5_HOMAM|nr:Cuticle protein [Homarus americanus]
MHTPSHTAGLVNTGSGIKAAKDSQPTQYGSLLSHTNIMRALVVLAVVGVCSAVPFVGDTPEVAAEKARFFQAYQAAQAAAQPQYNAIPHQAYNTGHYNPSHHNTGHYNHAPAQPKWTGPVAATVPAGVDGTITPVSDTRDVAAARNAFFNTYQAQVAATVGAAPHHHGGAVHYQAAPTYTPAAPVQPRWTGPVAATIPAGLPGAGSQVADTPEVAAAKQAFYSTFQRQAAAAAPPTRYY